MLDLAWIGVGIAVECIDADMRPESFELGPKRAVANSGLKDASYVKCNEHFLE